MYAWFGKWFSNRENDHTEPPLELEDEGSILCSQTGQILNEKGVPLWKWTAEQHRLSFPDRAIPDKQDHGQFVSKIQTEARQLLNNPPRESIRTEILGQFSEKDISITKLAIFSEDDIYLPCLMIKPSNTQGIPAVMFADSEGKTAENISLCLRLAESGIGVLIVDLRGYGETRITQQSNRDKAGGFEAQTLGIEAGVAYDGLKLGRSIFSMRVFDLLQAYDYLLSCDAIDPNRIGIIGRSSCGPLALYAALLEKQIKGVLLDNSLSTFSSLVTSRLYTYHFMDFLPRALRYHDFPQVAAALAPRVVWMLNLKDAYKNTLSLSLARKDYSWTSQCYGAFGEKESFQIKGFDSRSGQLSLYLEWAQTVIGKDQQR
jgi:cephalosporin-C deacetylase-like acetyl esterase